MIVTRIETVTKTKFRVYIDGQFAFVLYKSELSRYHIKENEEVTEAVFRLLKEEVVLKRAKLRAMHLLNDMDRTEEQLITKLKHNDYTDYIIEQWNTLNHSDMLMMIPMPDVLLKVRKKVEARKRYILCCVKKESQKSLLNGQWKSVIKTMIPGQL
jgi:hypothetical protein